MMIEGGAVVDYSTKFTIFTDGSALNNKTEAPAGMAVYIPLFKKLFSKSMIATNNQAELEAIRYALWWFKSNGEHIHTPDRVVYLFTDSEYSINSISGKWKKLTSNLAKISVIRQLIEDIKTSLNVEVRFIHVKAHTRKKDFISLNNDIVDQEARKKAMEQKASMSGEVEEVKD